MKQMLALAFLGSRLFANTSIVGVNATPQQLVILTNTDQLGFCTYRVSEGKAFVTSVNDVNATLFAGSNSDLRPGSITNGPTHVFVAGTRTASLASDHKRYSRSLQANTQHWIGVTCGSDTEVSTVAATTNPPLGNSFADPYPYDPTSATGYAWPTIDMTDKTKSYIDPRTGTLVKRLTGWQDEANSGDSPPAPTAASVSATAPTGNWTNPQRGAAVDGAAAVSTGTAPLAVAFSPIHTSYSATRPASWDPNNAGSTITDVQIKIAGSGTGGANNATVCLTVNRVSCATDAQTITLPSATGTVTYPTSMTNYFADWIGARVTTPPVNYDMATFSGTVNVSGTSVTCASPGQQVCFNVEALTNGSVINIGTTNGCTAGDYVIASVISDSSLTLQSPAGTCAGANYSAANFGVLIFPQGSAVLSIDGVTYTWDEHGFALNAQGGLSFYCNYGSQVTNQSGVSGWVCMLPDAFGNMTGYFLPSNLGNAGTAVNTIWSFVVPYSPDASINYTNFPQDQTSQSRIGSYLSSAPSDPSDPTTFYVLANDNQVTPSKMVLLSGHYDAAGSTSNCKSSGVYGYQLYVQSPNGQNPCVIWKNLTRASQGGTLTDLMVAFDSSFDPNYFNEVSIVDVKNGYIELTAATAQNFLTWFFFVSTSNFQVTAAWPLYKNFPIRWAGVHGADTMTDNTTTDATTQNLDPGGACPYNGCGPYQFPVSAINGNPGGALAATAGGTCSFATSKTAGLVPYGSGCVQMTFPGEPCDPDPSPYEMANFPQCSWNLTYRGLWVGASANTIGSGMAVAPGDTFIDLATGEGASGGEQFLVTGKVSGNTWEVLRNFALPRGPFLNDPPLSALKQHSQNFTARFMSGISVKDCQYYGNFTTDIHGTNLVCDQPYYPTSHGDRFTPATVLSEFYTNLNEIAFSVRSLGGSFLNQVNLPQTLTPLGGTGNAISANTGVAFGAGCQFISGLGCGSQSGGYLGAGHTLLANSDDHPSVRKGAAPASEEQSFLSSTRIGSFEYPIGGTTVTAISGSLYQISGVNMPYVNLTGYNTRYRPFVIWAGRHNMGDVSGPASSIDGTAANNWKYCIALLANECVSGSTPGSVYVNIPAAPNNLATGCQWAAYQNSWCVMPVSPDMDSITQVRYDAPSTNNGERARTVVKPFTQWFGTNTFVNAHFTPDASGVIFTCDWCAGVRTDLYWAKVPPAPPLDTVNRSNYVNVPIALSGLPGDQIRIRFGYAENGPPASLFCTTRQESCATDGSGVNPFLYLSETQQYSACDLGCIVNIPAVAGRVVYYVVDRISHEGSGPFAVATFQSSPMSAVAMN